MSMFTSIVEKVKAGTGSLIREVPQMLAFVASLTDAAILSECKAQASAIAEYLAQRKDSSVGEFNAAIKVRLKVDYRLGEVLKETVNHSGGGDRKSVSRTVTPIPDVPPGISRMQSSRAQQLTALPWEQLEAQIDAATEQNIRVSQAAVVKAVQKVVDPKPKQDPGNPVSGKWRVDHANCLDWLASQPEGSIDLVFGSPPYEMARLYLEGGEDKGIARSTEEWTAWMVQVVKASLRCCKGLVAFVVEGQTKDYRWTASPALLMADLHRAGITLRKPPAYHRVGIPGSGGPDWLRNDYEFIVCVTNGGQLPWSDNTAMGHPPKFDPGGDPTHRQQDGTRVNGGVGYATMEERNNVGPHRARQRAGRVYQPPERANPGNVITCVAGGGNMGDSLCHDNEAPFPERLAEFFVRSFCPAGGTVADPFCGSGTTGKMAVQWGRRFVGCDVRESQVKLSRRRLAHVQQVLPLEA